MQEEGAELMDSRGSGGGGAVEGWGGRGRAEWVGQDQGFSRWASERDRGMGQSQRH